MNCQGESQNETFKRKNTLVPKLKDRLRALDLGNEKNKWSLGWKSDRAQESCGQVTARQWRAGRGQDCQARERGGNLLIL